MRSLPGFSIRPKFSRFQKQAKASRKSGQTRLLLESLEERAVPAVVTWDGGAGTNYFWDKANWNTDTVPGKDDDVVVPALKNNADLIMGGEITLRSIDANATLVQIPANTPGHDYTTIGSLTVTSGVSNLRQGVIIDRTSMNTLSLSARGNGTVLNIDGQIYFRQYTANNQFVLPPNSGFNTIQVVATQGAQISLTKSISSMDGDLSLTAIGADSLISLRGLTTLTVETNSQISVSKGGRIVLPDLAQVTVNSTAGCFTVSTIMGWDYGGVIDLPNLKHIDDLQEGRAKKTSFTLAGDGNANGLLNTPSLQNLKNASISLNSFVSGVVQTWNCNALLRLEQSDLTYNVPGKILTLPSLQAINETCFHVTQGFVELPNVGVVDLDQMHWDTTWESNGKGSALTINAKEVRGQLGRGHFFRISALNDGLVNINSNSIWDDNAGKDDGGIFAIAKDNGILRLNVNQTAGMIVDLPSSGILAMDSVINARFKVFRGWDWDQGRFFAQKMQSFKIDTYIGSSYTVIKDSPRYGPSLNENHCSNPIRLEKIDASNVTRVEGDFAVAANPFPKLQEFYGNLTLDAGSSPQAVFSTPMMPSSAFSKINSINFNGKNTWPELFNAKQLGSVRLSFNNIAGTVEFTGVESITNQLSIYLADTTGVTLVFPKLTSFIDSSITAEYGVATIEVPVLRDASRSNLVFASDNNAWANAKGGKTWFVAPNLSCIDGTRFSIRSGNQISLPAVTDVILPLDNGNIPAWDIQGRTLGGFHWSSLTGPYPTDHVELDDPSKLSLPNLKTIRGGTAQLPNITTSSTISISYGSALDFNKSGSLLDGPISFIQSTGAILSGNLTVGPLATYRGNGLIQGSLTNQGTLNLNGDDSAYGNLSITGDFVQTTTGKSNIELGAANKTDRISANSSLVLDGQLNISLIDDFANSTVVPSATVQVFTGSSITYKSSKTLVVKQPGTNGNSVQIAFQPKGQAILSKPTPTPTPTPTPASPGNITWDGGAGTNRWSDPANWSGDQVPGSGSVVTIPAQSSINEILIDQSLDLARLTANVPLRLEAKSTATPLLLRVNSGASAINQGVILKGGSLATQYPGTTLDIYGQLKLEALPVNSVNTAPSLAGLQATNGSWLIVHDTKTILAGLNDLSVTATGGGARVMFPDLMAAHTQTTISGNVKSAIHLSANDGGAVEMPQLKSMSGDNINILIQNSWINMPLLAGLKNATINVTDTTSNAVQNAAWIVPELASLERSSLSITGEDMAISYPKVKSITQTNLNATRSKLYFPGVDKVDFNLFFSPGDNNVRLWTATGPGAVLEVRANSVSGNINPGNSFIAQASQSGLLGIYAPIIADQRLNPASSGGLFLKADTGGVLRAYNTATSGAMIDVSSGGAVAMDQVVQGQFQQISTSEGRLYASAMTSLTIADTNMNNYTPLNLIAAPKLATINGRFQAYANPLPLLSSITGSLKLLHEKNTPLSQVTVFNTPAAKTLSGFTVTLEQGTTWPQLFNQAKWDNLTVYQTQADGKLLAMTKTTATPTVTPVSTTLKAASLSAKSITKPKLAAKPSPVVKKTHLAPVKAKF